MILNMNNVNQKHYHFRQILKWKACHVKILISFSINKYCKVCMVYTHALLSKDGYENTVRAGQTSAGFCRLLKIHFD
jgi:hypothetical protein